jgi:hypothetical protein
MFLQLHGRADTAPSCELVFESSSIRSFSGANCIPVITFLIHFLFLLFYIFYFKTPDATLTDLTSVVLTVGCQQFYDLDISVHFPSDFLKIPPSKMRHCN